MGRSYTAQLLFEINLAALKLGYRNPVDEQADVQICDYDAVSQRHIKEELVQYYYFQRYKLPTASR